MANTQHQSIHEFPINIKDRKSLKRAYKMAFMESFSGLHFVAANRGDEYEMALEQFANELPSLHHPGIIRKKVTYLAKHRTYLSKKDVDDPAVVFLQRCGNLLEATDITEVFRSYGRNKLNTYFQSHEGNVTFSQFANGLERAYRGMFWSSLLWVVKYPEGIVQKIRSSSKVFQTIFGQYDSFKNQSVFLSTPLTDQEGHTIYHRYSPNLTGPNSIATTILIPMYRKQKIRWLHIDNQSTHHPLERKRIDEIQTWARNSENSHFFLHAVISTDALFDLGKNLHEFLHDGLDRYLQQYEAKIRGKNDLFLREYLQTQGMHISEKLLDTDELNATFTAIRNILLNSNFISENKKIIMLIHRMVCSVFSYAVMKKEQLHYDRSIFTENCRENIDRGPMENLSVIFLNELSQGQTMLNMDTVYLQAGITLGRADYAMARRPMIARIAPFLEWLRFVDANQTLVMEEMQKLRLVLKR